LNRDLKIFKRWNIDSDNPKLQPLIAEIKAIADQNKKRKKNKTKLNYK